MVDDGDYTIVAKAEQKDGAADRHVPSMSHQCHTVTRIVDHSADCDHGL